MPGRGRQVGYSWAGTIALATMALLAAPERLSAQGTRDWLRKPPVAAGIPTRPSRILQKIPVAPRLPTAPEEAEQRDKVMRKILTPALVRPGVPGAPIADARQRIGPEYFNHLPFSAITRILIKYRGTDVPYQGSGFLIESDLVLTAAHVLHSQEFGRAEEVVVVPGCFGDRAGYPPDPAFAQGAANQRLHTHERWGPPDYAAAFDYGAILLADSKQFQGCGRFRLQAVDDRYLADQMRKTAIRFIVSGYPVDKDLGQRQWMARGGLLSFGRGFIRHLIDTEKGESGSPLLDIGTETTTGRQVPVAFGVHSRGGQDGSYNVAARVDAEFLRHVKAWKEELERLRLAGN